MTSKGSTSPRFVHSASRRTRPRSAASDIVQDFLRRFLRCLRASVLPMPPISSLFLFCPAPRSGRRWDGRHSRVAPPRCPLLRLLRYQLMSCGEIVSIQPLTALTKLFDREDREGERLREWSQQCCVRRVIVYKSLWPSAGPSETFVTVPDFGLNLDVSVTSGERGELLEGATAIRKYVLMQLLVWTD